MPATRVSRKDANPMGQFFRSIGHKRDVPAAHDKPIADRITGAMTVDVEALSSVRNMHVRGYKE